MNKIHIVIKRRANIQKYLKQKDFSGKIARVDGNVLVHILDIPPADTVTLDRLSGIYLPSFLLTNSSMKSTVPSTPKTEESTHR